MEYLLLICVRAPFVPEDPEELHRKTLSWVDEMDAKGVRIHGSRIAPSAQAKTVRTRGGKVSVSDGPFVQAEEKIGGFDVIKCANLEDAVDIAARHPMAAYGSIEIRALVD